MPRARCVVPLCELLAHYQFQLYRRRPPENALANVCQTADLSSFRVAHRSIPAAAISAVPIQLAVVASGFATSVDLPFSAPLR